ncbi:MAG: TldD/PmbA family protein [Acidobacteriota bacterium]|nr:TldD/PmbA family protein [Acidobacteriota bacterium]
MIGPSLPFDIERRFGLDARALVSALEAALATGGDFAEAFLEYREYRSAFMEEDILKDTSESFSLGLGLRVWSGETTGYGYTNDLSPDKILRTARSAAAVAASGRAFPAARLVPRPGGADVYRVERPPDKAPFEAKIALVRAAYEACRGFSPLIEKVKASIQDQIQYVAIANSEGLLAADVRPLVRLTCVGIAQRNGLRESGYSGGGGRVGLEHFEGSASPEAIGREAAREAVDLLDARDAPAGVMPVVLAAGHAGVLIHEAVGHLLEADFNRRKTSIFWNKAGKKVGTPEVTIYDDPTIPASRGSYAIDDEGTIPRKTLLIEKGVVRGLLQDKLSAKLMGRTLTGHGRRQDYTDYPIPRMANTYIDRGEHDPAEIIRSVRKGLYAERFTGGQVEDSGQFTFSVSSGRLIEEGRLTAPVKQATLVGSNVDILRKIEMVGSDLAFGLPTGTCSKEGQDVPVNDGCPTLKISAMTVGGK